MMRRIITGLVVCTFIAAPALADITVNVKELSTTPATALTIQSSGYDGGAYVGVYDISIANPSAGYTGPLGTVESFCIDIWDLSTTSYAPYKVVSLDLAPDGGAGPMGATRAGQLAQLLNTYWVTGMSNSDKTALQTAVWEVVDEKSGTLNTGSGTFYVSSYGGNNAAPVITRANEMLGSITNGASFQNYLALSSPAVAGATQYQDYIVKVPIPAAFLLGMLGLGAAGVKLRRFA